jgi:large subunit ribosomal protein L27
MAHKKAAGSTKNGRDSNPRYLGIKLADGDMADIGSIILRQKGRNVIAGKNVGIGKDHTLFALSNGKVVFSNVRKINFNRSTSYLKKVSVV